MAETQFRAFHPSAVLHEGHSVMQSQLDRANSSKDILELLTEYPHLTSPGMMAQDFQVLHGEAAPKLFETWIPEYAEKVLYLAKQDNKLPSLSVEDMTL
ncbi:hypothetical protein M9458_044678, partial [Cirrhinus mrigala]